MIQRDLATGGTRAVPRVILQSIFISELLIPSKQLWLVSPWISNVPIIDNTSRQFSAVCPQWPATTIRLDAIIEALAERGCTCIIVINNDTHNDEFIERMKECAAKLAHPLRYLREKDLHEKGIVGDTFCLDGSMNLTYNGIYNNEEHLIYRCDRAVVAERHLVLNNRWERYLDVDPA